MPQSTPSTVVTQLPQPDQVMEAAAQIVLDTLAERSPLMESAYRLRFGKDVADRALRLADQQLATLRKEVLAAMTSRTEQGPSR